MEELAGPVSHLNVECTFVSVDDYSIEKNIWHPDSNTVNSTERVFLQLVFNVSDRRDKEMYIRSELITDLLDSAYDKQKVVDESRYDYVCDCCSSDFKDGEEIYWLETGQCVHSVCWESLGQVIEQYCQDNSELLVVDRI